MLDFSNQISHDTKRQLAVLLKEQERRKGLTDLHYFCKNILGYSDLTDRDEFHGDFCQHLESTKKRFKLTLTPRGSLKSSIGTIGHTLQDIVVNPNVRILLASQNFSIAVALLDEIKGHLTSNQKFIELYGDLRGEKKKSRKWQSHSITVKTRTTWKASPTITCAGIDVTKTGMHYDVIRVDDPHDDKNTNSQEQIDKVIRWYRLLFSLLDPGGRLFITGTIWHYNDLYSYIIRKERERVEQGRKKRFSIFKRDSFEGTNTELMEGKITEDKLLWPERLSSEFLRDQLIEQGPYIFSCQYRLRPTDDENAMFKRSWIRACDPEEIPDRLNVFTTIDPKRDPEGKDNLAIITCGMDAKWNCYILDVLVDKTADEHQTVEHMYEVYKRWKPIKMGFEAVAWQESYLKYVQMLAIQRGLKLPITPIRENSKLKKDLRIKGMVPYWKAGLFIIPAKNGLDNLEGGLATLVDELTRYPKVGNDDCVDALSDMNLLTHRPNVLSIIKTIPSGSFAAIRQRLKKPTRPFLGERNVREREYA